MAGFKASSGHWLGVRLECTECGQRCFHAPQLDDQFGLICLEILYQMGPFHMPDVRSFNEPSHAPDRRCAEKFAAGCVSSWIPRRLDRKD
jgi:hypothetical protein